MEKLELIISLLGALVATVATAATFIAKFVKSVKAKRVAEQTIEICNALLPFVEQAESFVHYSGEEKKQFVMTKANRYALCRGLAFDEQLVGEKVEELVALTKSVNTTPTPKSENNAPITASKTTENADCHSVTETAEKVIRISGR